MAGPWAAANRPRSFLLTTSPHLVDSDFIRQGLPFRTEDALSGQGLGSVVGEVGAGLGFNRDRSKRGSHPRNLVY